MKKVFLFLFLQLTFAFAANQAVRKIFLVGDSTMTNYRATAYPMTGWGQVLQSFLNGDAFQIDNRAIGGRSSRSFIEEGRWDEVKASISSGDFVFVQFGHNDRDWSKEERYTSPADYKIYLQQYVNEARALGAIPVLVTPMVLNAWRDGALRNVFTESGAEYVQRMKEVANELNVPLMDLNQKSWDYVNEIGVDYASRYAFNTYPAGEYPNYPDGLNDYTHFQEMGALQMTKFVVEGIQELSTHNEVQDLFNQLTPQYQVTVTSNVPGAGTITRSETYPAGVTVTLKALVNDGHTFLNWKDRSNLTLTTDNIYTFTMGTSAVNFQAIFDYDDAVYTDCAGVENGTAVLDDCGICTGGSSNVTPCSTSIEAETACEVAGVLAETNNAGYLGNGYVNTNNEIGSNIVWSINSTTAQTVSTSLRYANGGAANRNMTLLVNDITIGEIVFSPSGSWTTWASTLLDLELVAGANKIELQSVTAEGGPNIDLFAFTTNTLSTAGCEIDCSGILGGTAAVDDCEICSGGNTGLEPNGSCMDCNGEIDGTATVDDCGICTGGSTNLAPCTALIEGENACAITGVLLEASNTGFLGDGYANTDNALGASIAFYVSSTTDQSTMVLVRYANGGATNRDALIYVNDVASGSLLLPTTGLWTTWETATFEIPLLIGLNTISLEANSEGGLANIDLISWSDQSITPASCTITNTTQTLSDEVSVISPNPFIDAFTLQSSTPIEYQIVSEKGQLISTGTCKGSCEIGSDLDKGNYEIIITSKDQKQTLKAIKL